MTKDEVAAYLTGIGYSATNEKGVAVIAVDEPMALPEKNKLRKIMQSIGYKSSWGWRLKA
jgi:hypothetical protein